LQACLQKDSNFLPALTDMSMLMLQSLQYQEAHAFAKRALRINTYDPASNYYYGLANIHLNNIVDAKDGFDIAALDIRYRSAAYTQLGKIYFREKNLEKAISYSEKSLDFNRFNLEAFQLMAVIYRLQKNKGKAESTLNNIRSADPLNHFVRAEECIWKNSDENRRIFIGPIKNELPQETFVELASWYRDIGRDSDAELILDIAPQTSEVLYWQAYLRRGKDGAEAAYQKARAATPLFFFPFRAETEPILKWAEQKDNDWKPKYYLGLLYWHTNNLDRARELLRQCETKPDYAPFYVARASLFNDNEEQSNSDLEHAIQLDKGEWRYQKLFAESQIRRGKYQEALSTVEKYYQQHLQNYIMGMLYARTLLLSKKYKESDALLGKLNIIPFEGATDGRELYREAKLMQAVQEIQKKNYTKALEFIAASKLWPSNLGVGKPYDEDIDLRLEDWMSYLCYTRSGKTAQAKSSLERIVQMSRPYPSANDLVTAWAMEKANQKEKATQWLQERVNEYPENKILLWSKATFENKPTNEILKGEQNATVRILEEIKN
jgi:tetratricopeptide (TPR) repeat protein